jgi:prepilin peptidase CpaA
MNLLNPALWALWSGCLLLLIAAVINARTLSVPNRLSLPATVAGWLLALLLSVSAGIPSQGGGILPSLAATAIGFLLLIPFYASGWLGAGCVKMQMAFGAWVGCALDFSAAAWVTGLATLMGGVITAIGALIAARRSQGPEEAGSRFRFFPAQITLSLGSVCGVVAAGLLGWL